MKETQTGNKGRNQLPPDAEQRQISRDFFRRNRYMLDDRFVLRDGRQHPCAIICPGGGYSMVCSFIEGVPIAKKLNKMGISAFIVYYRVKKKAAFPNPQDDLARAVREVHENAGRYHVDMANYSVWGASAGGHLAGSFGTSGMGYRKYHLPKPGAIVLSYPVISMDRKLTHMGTHDNLLGKKASEESEAKRSIDQNVDADYPPTYIWCGDADTEVSPENTKRMVKALESAKVSFRHEIFPGVGHGVGPATGTTAEGWIQSAATFWISQRIQTHS